MNCENCKGKPTENLSGQEEQELIEKLIDTMKAYKITYDEGYRLLDCVRRELSIRASYLHL